jgi:hypothetical protein
MNDVAERKHLFRLWLRQFGGWAALYLIAYVGAMWGAFNLTPQPLRTALIIAPIVPGAAMIWNVVRSYRASDEFVRLQILEAAAVTALFTAFWTLAYAFLELLGLPHISVGFVHTFGWPVFIWKMVRLMRMRA